MTPRVFLSVLFIGYAIFCLYLGDSREAFAAALAVFIALHLGDWIDSLKKP